jgi:hypothetical protein
VKDTFVININPKEDDDVDVQVENFQQENSHNETVLNDESYRDDSSQVR